MSNGLGDKVEKIFEKTGVKRVVEKAAAAVGMEDCGCSKRRDMLNELGVKLGIGENGEVVETTPGAIPDDPDPGAPVNRRKRNAALKAAWEAKHGRPYGAPDPG